MLKHLSLDLSHAQWELDSDAAASFFERAQGMELPAFQQHGVDFDHLRSVVEPFQKYKNIIIIANGGSRTSALGYWQSLAHLRNEKRIEFLSTMEPDVLASLKERFSPEDTLVMPISKSGTNIDVLEPLFQLLEYPILAVTSPEKGVLYEIGQKYEWPIVPHPEVGGRYSGRSECAFAPVLLMGLDAEKINAAAVDAYASMDYAAPVAENLAYQAAAMTWHHDQQGKDEIFMPIYSEAVSGFLPLGVQLIHESTGKDGKGQTIFGDVAPESQHHTNQRYFGGKKNVLGWFITVAQQRTTGMSTAVPDELKDFVLRDGTLADVDGIPLEDGLRFDYEGVAENSTERGIPHMTLTVDEVNEESMGELMSFWHYYTVYSALLRDQDPFDQPEVEDAKEVSFQKRKAYAG